MKYFNAFRHNRTMQAGIRHLLIFLLLIVAGYSVYFYGIADLPHRDDTTYMLERTFVTSDSDWFLHSLSYTRVRALRQGDTFLFRPLHMAVLAAKDILLRNRLFASGAVNILLMSLAGFSLYLFAGRIVRMTAAIAIALLFMVQHAGIEMVVWGHISPYLLALTFFGFGLTSMMDATVEKRKPLVLAGVFFLAGALFHEIIILALVFAGAVLLYALMRSKGRATEGGVSLRSYLVWAVSLPVVAYLSLDIVDFLYRGAPHQFDALYQGLDKLPSAMMAAPGAAVMAFITPPVVDLNIVSGAFAWDFNGWMPLVVGLGSVASIALLAGIYATFRPLMKGVGSPLTVAVLIGLFMFMGFIIGVGYGRLYTRGIAYMYVSTYYYSITSYIFCLLIAAGVNRLSAWKRRPDFAAIARRGALTAIAALIAVNTAMTINTLKSDWPRRYGRARVQFEEGKALVRHSDRYCLASFISSGSNRLRSALLRRYACKPDDARTPVNLSPGPDGALWFVEVTKHPIAGAHPVELSKVEVGAQGKAILEPYYGTDGLSDDRELLLSDEEYDMPDLSLTLRHGLNAAVVFGYEDPGNYAVFRVDGPIVYGRLMNGGKLGGMDNDNALPAVKLEYSIEVRHSGKFIYLFVDGHPFSYLPSYIERKGRVGVFLQKSKAGDTSISDFIAGPSGGTNAPKSVPLSRITETSEPGSFPFSP